MNPKMNPKMGQTEVDADRGIKHGQQNPRNGQLKNDKPGAQWSSTYQLVFDSAVLEKVRARAGIRLARDANNVD